MSRVMFVAIALAALGCSDRVEMTDDAGVRVDADGSSFDGGTHADAGDPAPDAGDPSDAGPADAGAPIADAGTDACVRTCPPLMTGCRYLGATECSCGELVCDPGGTRCSGGPFGMPCDPYEWCDAPGGTCGLGGTATCATRPDACDAIDAPVCGCDRRTYANACEAHRAGVDEAADGPCPPDPPPDRVCTIDEDCMPGEVCAACPTPFGDRHVCRLPGAGC